MMDKGALQQFADHWNNGTWLACGKKKKFKTLQKAEACAEQYNQRAYVCPHCGGFHTASKK